MYSTLCVKATVHGVYSDIHEECEKDREFLVRCTNQWNIKLLYVIHRFDHQLNQAFNKLKS